jgi:PAS domain S-box-containing protein
MTQIQESANYSMPAVARLSFDLFDKLPVAIYTCDKYGYVTAFNKAAEKLWGRKPAIGKDLWCGSWKIFYTDGTPMPLDACPMARTLKEGDIFEEEIIIQRPDGSTAFIQPHPVPMYNDSGELVGAVNTLIDITEQKKNEPKQAMLAAIIESSDDAIISKTLDGIITSWNHSAEKMYGYKEAEAVGKYIGLIIPDNRMDEEALIISKISSGEKVDHYETRRRDKWGKEIPVSLTISPIRDSSGKILGASKVARDISRFKYAEESQKRYTENLEILYDIGKKVSESLNVEDILQKVTDATTKLTGAAFGAFFYNKLDDKGQPDMVYTLSGVPREAFDKFGMPLHSEVFHKTFTGQKIYRSDNIIKDPLYGKTPPHYGLPKGHLPVVSYLAVPVISKTGNVVGGLFYGHPEEGKFTREHEQLVSSVISQAIVALDNAHLYEEVKRLNSKKDEFIGMASHELKTPVTSLKGYLQIFARNLSDDDHNKTYIDKAVVQINKLSGLISDLLDVSKIETGKLPLSFSQFDLKQLLVETVELMQYSSKSHQINFQSDEKEVIISADRQRIEQVVINLISNATKYSPQANKVDISLRKKDKRAVVEVQDFGIGIKEDQQSRIFSRFYRVDELASHISGLGIGLYLSHEIITRHQGSLSVKSEPGKGSTFIFDLPL